MNFIEKVIRQKEVELREKKPYFKDIENSAYKIIPVKSRFVKQLSQPGLGVIAEVKLASPSAGKVSDYAVEELASIYRENGADCASVLTEEKYFNGSVENISKVKKVFKGPVLMKDFIISEYQIYEGIAAGAEAVLLIASILSEKQLKFLSDVCFKSGVTALVEVHSKDDLLKCGCLKNPEMIGVNTRDLFTLEVKRETAEQLIGSLPEEAVKVAESGIRTSEQAKEFYDMGYDAVLVGEAVAGSADPGKKLRDLKQL